MKTTVRIIGLILVVMMLLSTTALAFEELAKGSKGYAVEELQNKLNELGYSVGTADGDFGGKTVTALQQFQTDEGLEATGILDEATYNALFKPDAPEEDPRFLIQGTDGTYGYCNEEGEIVIPCQWYEAEPFDNGIARVKTKDKSYGYINKTGELIVPYRSYMVLPQVRDGYLCHLRDGADENGPYDIYNAKGEIVYTAESCEDELSIYVSKEGVVWELEEGGIRFYSFTTRKEKTLTDMYFSGLGYFSEGLLLARQRPGKDVYVNKNGEVVICFEEFDGSFDPFRDGRAQVYDSSQNTVGFIDQTGDFVIPCIWAPDSTGEFSEGLCVVAEQHYGPRGYINTAGEVVIPLQYSYAQSFRDGLAAVMNDDGLWGYINQSGETVIDYTFNDAEDFRNGYALVSAGAYRFYIDKEGNPAFSFNVGQSISDVPGKEELIQASLAQKQADREQKYIDTATHYLEETLKKAARPVYEGIQIDNTEITVEGSSALVMISFTFYTSLDAGEFTNGSKHRAQIKVDSTNNIYRVDEAQSILTHGEVESFSIRNGIMCGDTMAEVEEKEKLAIAERTADTLTTVEGNVAGIDKSYITYSFDANGGLYDIRMDFGVHIGKMEQAIAGYDAVYEALVSKYGDPVAFEGNGWYVIYGSAVEQVYAQFAYLKSLGVAAALQDSAQWVLRYDDTNVKIDLLRYGPNGATSSDVIVSYRFFTDEEEAAALAALEGEKASIQDDL